MSGKGSHLNSPILKKFVLAEAPELAGRSVIIDLAACTGMDSTFMGILSCLAGHVEAHDATLQVVNAAGRNGELLRGLGLDNLFSIQDGTAHLPPAPACAAVEPSPCTRGERTAVCLEAHEALAAADPRNAETFRDVIDLMREEVARELVH